MDGFGFTDHLRKGKEDNPRPGDARGGSLLKEARRAAAEAAEAAAEDGDPRARAALAALTADG